MARRWFVESQVSAMSPPPLLFSLTPPLDFDFILFYFFPELCYVGTPSGQLAGGRGGAAPRAERGFLGRQRNSQAD